MLLFVKKEYESVLTRRGALGVRVGRSVIVEVEDADAGRVVLGEGEGPRDMLRLKTMG